MDAKRAKVAALVNAGPDESDNEDCGHCTHGLARGLIQVIQSNLLLRSIGYYICNLGCRLAAGVSEQ